MGAGSRSGRFGVGRALLLGHAVLALAPGTAAAAPVEHVTTSADSGPGSLRAAVAAVDPGGTVIIDAPHDPALASQVVINRTLTLVGQGAGATVITGSANDRVLDLDSVPEATVTIRALTITGGNAPDGVGTGNEGGDGGGIRAGVSITLILDSVVLAGNRAGDGAAGQSSPSENGGSGGDGGGLYTEGAQTTIQDSWFLNNTAGRGGDGGDGSSGGMGAGENGENGGRGGDGGAVAAKSSAGPLNFIDSTLSGNAAGRGGDGGQGGSGAPPGSSIPGAEGGYGGGVFRSLSSLSSLVLVNSTLEGNSAGAGGTGGGGLSPAGGGEGGNGGGAYGGPTVIDSSTIARNSAGAGGAGIVVGDPGTGGGVGAAPLTVARTILASNSASTLPQCSQGVFNGGDNLVFPADPLGCMPGASINADPLLGPLAGNGGPTPTLALGAGSPAIDRYSAFCAAADQRGVSRPQGAACDIGAFERVPEVTPPATTPPAPPTTTPPATAPAKKCKKGFVLKKVKTKRGTKKKCVKKKKKRKK